MKRLQAPTLESRREEEFFAELCERARLWIPQWELEDLQGDFGKALLEVAARFGAEVAERLDRCGDKLPRGLADWLAVRGKAAIPARMPIVFKMLDSATQSVLAAAGSQVKADASGTLVTFETLTDLNIVPAHIDKLIAVEGDKIFLPPPGLTSLKPLASVTSRWKLKSSAKAGNRLIQVEPESDLVPGTIFQAGDSQYRMVKAEGNLVTIEPPLVKDLPVDRTELLRVTEFKPYHKPPCNWQEHAIYIGDEELLNVESAAYIIVDNADEIPDNAKWQYWGKLAESPDEPPDWYELKRKSLSRVTLEKKDKGPVEMLEMQGRTARWIRAVTNQSKETITFSEPLKLRISSENPDKLTAPRDGSSGTSDTSGTPTEDNSTLTFEGMANSTPLVLEKVFHPLGREPKQFDAFYLGCEEAYSKKGATAKLEFDLGGKTFKHFTRFRFPNRTDTLAGIARDGTLNFLTFSSDGTLNPVEEPRQPPEPRIDSEQQPPGASIKLIQPTGRLPTWIDAKGNSFLAMPSESSIWVWLENKEKDKSGWIELGPLPPTIQAKEGIASPSLIVIEATGKSPLLVALRDGLLFVYDLSDLSQQRQWEPITLSIIGTVEQLASIDSIQGEPSTIHELIGLSAQTFYGIVLEPDAQGKWFAKCNETFKGEFDTSVGAIANRQATGQLNAAIESKGNEATLIAKHGNKGPTRSSLGEARVIGTLEFHISESKRFILGTVERGSEFETFVWSPEIESILCNSLLNRDVPFRAGPTVTNRTMVVAADQNLVYTSSLEGLERPVFTVTQQNFNRGIVLLNPTPALVANDIVARVDNDRVAGGQQLTSTGHSYNSEVLFEGTRLFKGNIFIVYRKSTVSLNRTVNGNAVTLESANEMQKGDWLYLPMSSETQLNDRFVLVENTDTVEGVPTAFLSRELTEDEKGIDFGRTDKILGRVVSYLKLDDDNGNWTFSLLKLWPLRFFKSDGTFSDLRLDPFKMDAVSKIAAFKEVISPFDGKFVQGEPFFGEWKKHFGIQGSNPELSWEFWNGTGWGALNPQDATGHLRNSGQVKFDVPSGIASGDWAGRMNYWIRARLIGGDYGKEIVTITTVTTGNTSDQTIDRSNSGFTPPVVLSLKVSYEIKENAARAPKYLLTQDSGSFRDQSEANRLDGQVVEAFIPFPESIARFSSEQGRDDDSSTSKTNRGRRSVFIGLDGIVPANATVNLFLKIDEVDHVKVMPLVVEAIVADRFVTLTVDDQTQALGESGLINVSFSLPPSQTELFGHSRHWLRISPSRVELHPQWRPIILGAYINAVWASATETMTRELLGSADGSPHLTVQLARPPILHESLELRVREPLSQSERLALLSRGPKTVLSDVQNLPGDWVLWKQVPDPLDEASDARVYSLDEATGIVGFGDGLGGMIPPIGRDCIVAFGYQRTEADVNGLVPANSVTARTPLSLASSLANVESAVAAGDAAGGAPPETTDQALQNGLATLNHRGRAITQRDLEEFAVASSPDIAQARVSRHRGSILLTIVRSGTDPIPTSAQRRELKRFLNSVTSPALSEHQALVIQGPKLRRLHLKLDVLVESLDHASRVADAIKVRLQQLFDTARGGVEGRGWPLGANINCLDELSLALADIQHLACVLRANAFEVVGEGSEIEWPAELNDTDLLILSDDPVRIEFHTDLAPILASPEAAR